MKLEAFICYFETHNEYMDLVEKEGVDMAQRLTKLEENKFLG